MRRMAGLFSRFWRKYIRLGSLFRENAAAQVGL